MAKLKFKQGFTLEVGDDIYTGELVDLTKPQKKEWDKFNAAKKAQNDELNSQYKQITRLQTNIKINEKLNDWAEVKRLNSELEPLQDSAQLLETELEKPKDIEDMFKKRIEWSVKSDDLDAILDAGDSYGYRNVFETILQDLKDQNEKK